MKPGQLLPIEDDETISRAVGLLGRGFPERTAGFWREAFARIETLRQRWGQFEGPLGQLLAGRDGDAGVLLTFRSRRRSGNDAYGVCNLSGWYVAPSHRFMAPVMLRRALAAESGSIVTDLTASPIVESINTKLGFSLASEGAIIAAAMPWAALPRRAGHTIIPYTPETRSSLRPWQHDMVEAHLGLGCLAAVIETPEGTSPLLLRIVRRRKFRIAQVMYAERRSAVVTALPCLMRFLLRHEAPFVSIDAPAVLCPFGAYFRKGQKRFHLGPLPPDRLDYAYSELPILGI